MHFDRLVAGHSGVMLLSFDSALRLHPTIFLASRTHAPQGYATELPLAKVTNLDGTLSGDNLRHLCAG